MKKYIKYLVITILCLLIIGTTLILYKKDRNSLSSSILKNYDLAITRKDINCQTNTIYLKKDQIYIVYINDRNKQEIVKIYNNINIDDMVNYVKEKDKDEISGLTVTLTDGTTKVISDSDNVVANFLREEELIDTFCERKISSNCSKIKCFEDELNEYILSEKESTDILLNEITDKSDKINYYKGLKTDDEEIYIIVETNLTYEWEVMRDFELYFAKKYPIYQSYNIPNTGIYIYTHNSANDIDFKAIQNKCNKSNLNDKDGKEIPSKTLNKLNETNKIIIKSGDTRIGTITNEKSINEILDIISTSKQYGDVFLADGHSFDFLMFNDKNELIDTIYIWHNWKRLIPKSMGEELGYYLITNKIYDLKEIVSRETDYVFYDLLDYSEDYKGEQELIYETDKYKYYLKDKKSDEVLISFNLTNLTMTLKYALNNNYITPDKLEIYSDFFIKEKNKLRDKN